MRSLALLDGGLFWRVSLIKVLAITSIALPLYFLPAILGRRKRRAFAIFALDFLFGWTVIGWIVALVLALTPQSQQGSSVLEANATPSNPRRCHICGKHSSADKMFSPHCGTAFLPEELRTAMRASPPPLNPPIPIRGHAAITRQPSEAERKKSA